LCVSRNLRNHHERVRFVCWHIYQWFRSSCFLDLHLLPSKRLAVSPNERHLHARERHVVKRVACGSKQYSHWCLHLCSCTSAFRQQRLTNLTLHYRAFELERRGDCRKRFPATSDHHFGSDFGASSSGCWLVGW